MCCKEFPQHSSLDTLAVVLGDLAVVAQRYFTRVRLYGSYVGKLLGRRQARIMRQYSIFDTQSRPAISKPLLRSSQETGCLCCSGLLHSFGRFSLGSCVSKAHEQCVKQAKC